MPNSGSTRVFRGERDEYQATASLGEGSMGVTYRVRRRRDGATFVLKELRLERVAEWKAAVDPSGTYMVTGGADELAKLWEL